MSEVIFKLWRFVIVNRKGRSVTWVQHRIGPHVVTYTQIVGPIFWQVA